MIHIVDSLFLCTLSAHECGNQKSVTNKDLKEKLGSKVPISASFIASMTYQKNAKEIIVVYPVPAENFDDFCYENVYEKGTSLVEDVVTVIFNDISLTDDTWLRNVIKDFTLHSTVPSNRHTCTPLALGIYKKFSCAWIHVGWYC